MKNPTIQQVLEKVLSGESVEYEGISGTLLSLTVERSDQGPVVDRPFSVEVAVDGNPYDLRGVSGTVNADGTLVTETISTVLVD